MNTTQTSTANKRPQGPAPLLVVSAFVLLVAYALWGAGIESRATRIEAPDLYLPAEQCSRGGDPNFYAQSAADRAQIKMARYPFQAGDGAQALALLSEAEQCLLEAGKRSQAAVLASRRKAFEARVDNDYRALRLRLAQALKQGRTDDAAREARTLSALLNAQRKHPYARWLSNVQRASQ